jgi:membrane associated rhomboid family serine protease
MFFGVNVWSGLTSLGPGPHQGGGVAFFAHIGGFAFGAATVGFVAKQRPLRPSW